MQTTRSKAVIVAAVLVASTSLTLAQGGGSSGGSAGVDTSTGGIRTPRIINDPAVGSGQTAETSAGGNSGLPKSSGAPSKANGC
jgi:hypothetical protein